MLRFRLLSAAILLTGIFSLIFLDAWRPLWNAPGLYLIPAGMFFVFATSFEFASLVKNQFPIRRFEVAGLSCLVFLSACTPLFYRLLMDRPYPADCPLGKVGIILVTVLLVTSWSSVRMLQDYSQNVPHALVSWAFASLIPLYVGGGACFWFLIRDFSLPAWGLWAVVSVITIAKMSDTGAYFVGRSLGKTKLCPSISPGKTIEGALGGVVFAMVTSCILFAWLLPMAFTHSVSPWEWGKAAIFGAILAVIGIFGDLVESVVKRASQSKDSGSILPGLGGIWDVTDSLLPTAVAGFLGIVAKLVWYPA